MTNQLTFPIFCGGVRCRLHAINAEATQTRPVTLDESWNPALLPTEPRGGPSRVRRLPVCSRGPPHRDILHPRHGRVSCLPPIHTHTGASSPCSYRLPRHRAARKTRTWRNRAEVATEIGGFFRQSCHELSSETWGRRVRMCVVGCGGGGGVRQRTSGIVPISLTPDTWAEKTQKFQTDKLYTCNQPFTWVTWVKISVC